MHSEANKTHYTLDLQDITTNSKLQVLSFDGIEAINSSYIFEITLVSNHLRYDITQLLSKNAFLSFTPDKAQGIHGNILFVKRGAVGKDYSLFKIIIASRFYHLNHETQQRAFIDKSVIEIISILLTEKGYQHGIDFEFKLKEEYPKRDFCCQYNETTAHFIYRLCQEEGINIHYQHSLNNHLMVFSDNNHFFANYANSFQYCNDTGLVADYPVFKRFDINLSSATTTASYRNFNFENMKIPEASAQGTQHKKANNAIEPNLEFYNYPQKHLNQARGDHYAKIEIERLRTNHILAEAYTDITTLHSGYCFTVDNYPALDSLDTGDKWLITQIYHQARQPQVLEALGNEASALMQEPALLFKYYTYPINEALQLPLDSFKQGYRNFLVSIPHTVQIRPQRLHPKPKVLGTQTAIVTGAEGEEIYTDEYGRVKILFHWDRINPANENSSHWVRVASNWAGDGYGAVIIPRVGMEVVIDFIEGDIDQPIVSGCLHNGVNQVPYELPANKTRSVFKTSSSKGGIGSNELRIEDKTNQEQIFIQSQKDYDQLTKNNHTVQINNNSHLQVQNEHSETIKGNRYTKNKAEEHHLTNLDRKTQILGNDYTQIALSQHESIGTVKTISAGMEIHLKSGMQTVIDGGLSLTLKAGGQHIILNPSGIYMTMPVWTGGLPMEGTPSAPLPPLHHSQAVTPTNSPPIVLAQREALLTANPICAICELTGGN
ncbi:type VI secretion system Vgr family protein [Entomomonas asaccharolytica]|uniref:Type VI secretion system tip protein VgrG n=1 Tax=Entomomonas asaccharolytica TaxID=2785331 RepID=A0A974NF97_9GAMM|nr:type VI secretion system tip protein TssI/VgrG [Entomomonas asaccharolytica]QQP85463.1 type VI secretion system tip protein VgrG [Entomomonas asaccharolytica]